MYKDVFGKRLKRAREMNGMTQDEAAKEMGIARSSLSKYEVSISEPGIERIGKFAEFYGVSIDWLFGLAMQGAEPNHIKIIKRSAGNEISMEGNMKVRYGS